jgi:hypothetical protein
MLAFLRAIPFEYWFCCGFLMGFMLCNRMLSWFAHDKERENLRLQKLITELRSEVRLANKLLDPASR